MRRERPFQKPNMPTGAAPQHLDKRTPVLKIDYSGWNPGKLEVTDAAELIVMDDGTLISIA